MCVFTATCCAGAEEKNQLLGFERVLQAKKRKEREKALGVVFLFVFISRRVPQKRGFWEVVTKVRFCCDDTKQQHSVFEKKARRKGKGKGKQKGRAGKKKKTHSENKGARRQHRAGTPKKLRERKKKTLSLSLIHDDRSSHRHQRHAHADGAVLARLGSRGSSTRP